MLCNLITCITRKYTMLQCSYGLTNWNQFFIKTDGKQNFGSAWWKCYTVVVGSPWQLLNTESPNWNPKPTKPSIMVFRENRTVMEIALTVHYHVVIYTQPADSRQLTQPMASETLVLCGENVTLMSWVHLGSSWTLSFQTVIQTDKTQHRGFSWKPNRHGNSSTVHYHVVIYTQPADSRQLTQCVLLYTEW